VTLEELLAEAAAELAGATIGTDPSGSTTWSRGGKAFAAVSVDGSVASFRLVPAIAAAAIRTPDTMPSGRGTGWVDFAPDTIDDHAEDRAVAWLESAYRALTPRD
jgi:hypothetical protein